MSRWLALAAIACALVVGDAGAHAARIDSEPADGAVLARPPAMLTLRFDEPVTPLSLRLLDRSGGERVLADGVIAEGATVRVPWPTAVTAPGAYWLSYRVTSSDSHPVAGAIAFTIGAAAANGVAPPALARLARVEVGPRIAARALQDFALLLCAGTALFALWGAPLRSERYLSGVSAWVVIAAAVAGVATQGAAQLGGDVNPLTREAWRAGMSGAAATSAGTVIAGALVVAAAALVLQSSARRAWLVLGVVLLVVGTSIGGHPATMHPRAVALSAIVIHVLAAAFWLGSLAALWLLAGGVSGARAAPSLQRFSRYASWAVAGLAAAAATLAWLQLGWPPALFDNAYGSLIAAKTLLFVLLLVLAAWNRVRLLPGLLRGDATAAVRLRASMAAELVLLTLTTSVAAALSQTPPPKAGPRVPADLAQTVRTPLLTATLSVAPGHPGANTVTARLSDRDGAAVDPAEVVFELAAAEAADEAVIRRPQRVAPGTYRWSGSELAFAGPWRVTVRARVSDFDLVRLEATVTVQ